MSGQFRRMTGVDGRQAQPSDALLNSEFGFARQRNSVERVVGRGDGVRRSPFVLSGAVRVPVPASDDAIPGRVGRRNLSGVRRPIRFSLHDEMDRLQ